MRIVVRPDAAADIERAYRWYRAKSESLGAAFLASVRVAATRIREYPDAYPVLRRNARRIRLKRFPYALIYRVYPETIAVLACIHANRDPRRSDTRLGG